jgi:hypothetical protein
MIWTVGRIEVCLCHSCATYVLNHPTCAALFGGATCGVSDALRTDAGQWGSARTILLVLGPDDSLDGNRDLATASDERETAAATSLRVDCRCVPASVLCAQPSRPEPKVRLSSNGSLEQSRHCRGLRLVPQQVAIWNVTTGMKERRPTRSLQPTPGSVSALPGSHGSAGVLGSAWLSRSFDGERTPRLSA